MEGHASLIKAPAILYDAMSHILSPDNERATSIAAIKECVSAIEAFMNELGELGHGYEKHGHSEANLVVLLGRNLRAAEAERKPIKQKIQIAYQALTGKKLSKGNLPTYQKFSLMVDIRNELTHPKASVINIGIGSLTPPKNEQKMIKRLSSYGFKCSKESPHDWTNAVSNKEFSKWSYQTTVELMVFILYLWPHPESIDSFLEMYGIKQYVKG